MPATTVDWKKLRPRVTRKLLGDLTQRIVQHFDPQKVILFGSYAYGRPTIESDVDLFVIMESTESVFARIGQVQEIAEVPFLPMDIIVRTPAEVTERLAMRDDFVKEILQKGRVLYERSK